MDNNTILRTKAIAYATLYPYKLDIDWYVKVFHVIPEMVTLTTFGLPYFLVAFLDRFLIRKTHAETIAYLIEHVGFRLLDFLDISCDLFIDICKELSAATSGEVPGIYLRISSIIKKPYVTDEAICILLDCGALLDIKTDRYNILLRAIRGNVSCMLYNDFPEEMVIDFVKYCRPGLFYKICTMQKATPNIICAFLEANPCVRIPIKLKYLMDHYGILTTYSDEDCDNGFELAWLDLGYDFSEVLRLCASTIDGNVIMRSEREVHPTDEAILHYIEAIMATDAVNGLFSGFAVLYELFDKTVVNSAINKIFSGEIYKTASHLEETFSDVITGSVFPNAFIETIKVFYGFSLDM